MSSPLNFTITAPLSRCQNLIANQSTSSSCSKTNSLSGRIQHFLSDPNDAPDYGYQDNPITGIGFWLMLGGRFAVSIYNRGNTANTIFNSITLKVASVAVALLTLPLTLTGAAMKIIGSQFPYRVENLTIADIPKTIPTKVDQVYELLKIADELLREAHINYSMDGGTLLGAVRHQGMIPWDDDGDLIIMDCDKAKLIALKDKLKEKGIVFQDAGLEAFKLTFDAETLQNRFGTTINEAANLDIFVMAEDHDGKIRPKSDYYKHLFPKEYFPKEELQNLQDYSFGPPEKGLRLKGPAHPTRYLNTFYGPECFEYALQTHSHIQLGPLSFPILNFSKTRYKITNPTFAEGNIWKSSL